MTLSKVAVLGAGSWGTALAKLLSDKGHETHLWARREAQARAIEQDRENAAYLPGFALASCLHATSNLAEALEDAELLVSVVPTHGLRSVLEQAMPLLREDAAIASASKGIENESLDLVSQIFDQHLPPDRRHFFTCIGGPSFAKEVAAGIPTAVSVGGHDERVTAAVQEAFTTDRFRVYSTDDVIGVEVGGAMKNVIAIAAGIADGLGFGHNTRAALITRGLAEISRLAVNLGAHPLTLAGLSGMGDLVLTATGDLSRNRTVGLRLGRGQSLEEILGDMTQVAEGVKTTRSARDLAAKIGVDMPITETVYAVLYEGLAPRAAVADLMTRPPRAERG
ncbi:MAG: NAD(P)-dependent glycerol-3-phosphate dehydrogenase [Deltaproteobacteria bacterium]|nr:NAD(P)-dependent glycerol-3-phosphate dehydrogenase [Deltaproteobacteria bacterium]